MYGFVVGVGVDIDELDIFVSRFFVVLGLFVVVFVESGVVFLFW